ncbi:hypothetical protein [Paraglaciecola arctica]|uniref:hypothetical protein n=1 Tax=Paraglaciecola arctica TaxID=1128911 RepID=UPI001C06B198|nr:hypothetical protein [Paraglaciecola arctica]MBU3004746.1 hypothetical protein [Paraglaciecola arctica]
MLSNTANQSFNDSWCILFYQLEQPRQAQERKEVLNIYTQVDNILVVTTVVNPISLCFSFLEK